MIKYIYKHELCYQCSTDFPDFLFGNLRIQDIKYELFTAKKSCEYIIKAMFKRDNGIKISNLIINKNKAVIIPDQNFQTNRKLFMEFIPKNACKIEFAHPFWLPLLDKLQPVIVDFAIFFFGSIKYCNRI